MIKIEMANPEDQLCLDQMAQLLLDEFCDLAPEAWPDWASVQEEVAEALQVGRICRIARDEAGRIIGWIGALPLYGVTTWELHPLVVARDQQGKGIGRQLVADLERHVAQQGGLNLFLGTDDEMARTSLAGLDLYPDPLQKLQTIRNLRRHPFTFYQKCGFVIVGVLPDANGFGKPDIFMAKRID